jgi:hypothetical protein
VSDAEVAALSETTARAYIHFEECFYKIIQEQKNINSEPKALRCQPQPVSRIKRYFTYVLFASQHHSKPFQAYGPTSMGWQSIIKSLKMILEGFRL